MDFTSFLLWDVKGRKFFSESLSQKPESVTEPLREIHGFQSVLMTKPRLATVSRFWNMDNPSIKV